MPTGEQENKDKAKYIGHFPLPPQIIKQLAHLHPPDIMIMINFSS
jgi:hypothetical protein